MKSKIFEVPPQYPPKSLYLCLVDDIESLATAVTPCSRHFGVFLALDAGSMEVEKITRVAENLLAKSRVFLCGWGPDCRRVHDIFVEVDVEMDPEQNKPVVMTTSDSDESTEEAVWFFVHSAFGEAYAQTCCDWIFAPVGSRNWEKAIRDS